MLRGRLLPQMTFVDRNSDSTLSRHSGPEMTQSPGLGHLGASRRTAGRCGHTPLSSPSVSHLHLRFCQTPFTLYFSPLHFLLEPHRITELRHLSSKLNIAWLLCSPLPQEPLIVLGPGHSSLPTIIALQNQFRQTQGGRNLICCDFVERLKMHTRCNSLANSKNKNVKK